MIGDYLIARYYLSLCKLPNMVTHEERKRGIYGGIFLGLGGLPLVLFYGFHPFGFLGTGLLLLGFVISYGAYRFEVTGR